MSRIWLQSPADFFKQLLPTDETVKKLEEAEKARLTVCCVKSCSSPAVRWKKGMFKLRSNGFCDLHASEEWEP